MLDVDDGVIATDKSDTSTKVWEVVEKVSVLTDCNTCSILPPPLTPELFTVIFVTPPDCSSIIPDVSELILSPSEVSALIIEAIFYPYNITHLAPLGTVTVTPVFIVNGDTLIPFVFVDSV